MITKFDATAAKLIQQAMVEAMLAKAKDLGVTVRGAGGKITATNLTLKFDFQFADPTAAADAEKIRFKKLCIMFGIRADEYGVTVKDRFGKVIGTLIGFEPSRSKYCVRIKTPVGVRLYPESILDCVKQDRGTKAA